MSTPDLASALFGQGRSAADRVRTRLIERLGAEAEWCFVSGDADPLRSVVHWVSGPCTTSFIVRPMSGRTPGLGVLEVMTVLGEVRDGSEAMRAARANVNLLNIHTNLNRWTVVGDPGPEGWTTGPLEPMVALVHASPPGTRHVVCAASFVVGDQAIELPVEAVESTVREQIAKVTALMSAGLPELWGVPLVGGMPDDRTRVRPDDWHEVVYHYERGEPAPDVDPSVAMNALVDAFNVHVTRQTGSGGPFWLGATDATGFTCEVPYGPGPFPGGAVWAANPRSEAGDPTTATSLVRAHITSNPHLGDGILLTMRLPVAPPPEHRTLEWTAALLNEQASLTAPGATIGTAHGIGAWVELDGRVEYRCFVPASWFADPDGPDPRRLFHELLANVARLSWSARHVVEFDPFHAVALMNTRHVPRTGLAAGVGARGPAFGELGLGTDPGAELLAHAFELTVGSATESARLESTGRAFEWSPDQFRQRFETEPCRCSDDPGALVSISTALGIASSDEFESLFDDLRRLSGGHPFAVCRLPGGDIELRSQLHVHDGTVGLLRSWPTAIAVAQALAAEHLCHLEPVVGRADRDPILAIFDLPNFRTPSEARDVPDGVERHGSSLYGPTLTVETRFDTPVDAETTAWVLGANAQLLAECWGSVTGGFLAEDGVLLRSCLPLGLERDPAAELRPSLGAMLLEAHRSMVAEAISQRPDLCVRAVSDEADRRNSSPLRSGRLLR